MSNRIKYDIVGYTLSGTPQQLYSRTVKHWMLFPNPDNVDAMKIRLSGGSGNNYIPLSPGQPFGHGDLEKQGNDDYLDITELYIEGTVSDLAHLIVMFEDR